MQDVAAIQIVETLLNSRRRGSPLSIEHLCEGKAQLIQSVKARIDNLEADAVRRIYKNYRETRARGTFVSIEALCVENPHLVDRVKRHIQESERVAQEDPSMTTMIIELGRYKIVEKLGEGGMAIVYKALDPKFERHVAIKILKRKVPGADRLLEESKKATKLEGEENVVRIYDVERIGEDDVIIMELLAGSVHGLLEKNQGKLKWDLATLIIAGACRGLAAAHRKEIVHGDIKPANILINHEGVAKLADFGVGGALTPAYMAPGQSIDPHAEKVHDVFKLGLTYYVLLCGVHKTDSNHPNAASPRIEIVLERLPAALPAALRGVLEKAVKTNTADRYQNGGEMLGDLETAYPKIKAKGRSMIPGLTRSPNDTPASAESTPEGGSSRTQTLTLLATQIVNLEQLANRMGGQEFDSLIKGFDHRLADIARQFKVEQAPFGKGEFRELAFGATRDAVNAGLLLHRTASSDSELKQFSLRTCVHLGDVVRTNGGFFGKHAAIASAVVKGVSPGQFVITDRVLDAVRENAASWQGPGRAETLKLTLKPLGRKRYEDTYVVVHEVSDEASSPIPSPTPVGNTGPTTTPDLRSASRFVNFIAGALPVDSPVYVRRSFDNAFEDTLQPDNAIICVQAPIESGRSSLLVRGQGQVMTHGYHSVFTDLGALSDDHLTDERAFFCFLVDSFSPTLRGKVAAADCWNPGIALVANLDAFLIAALGRCDTHLFWFMDQVDRLVGNPLGVELLTQVRRWGTSGRHQQHEPWKKLSTVLAHMRDPQTFLLNSNQSPFNASTEVVLKNFTLDEVKWLNNRCGKPVGRRLTEFIAITGGQPCLVQRGMRALAQGTWNWRTTDIAGLVEHGMPFYNHLSRVEYTINNDPAMQKALELLRSARKTTAESLKPLRCTGILASLSERRFSNALYAAYFGKAK